MAKFGKKYQDAAKLVEAGKAYDLAEAIEVKKLLLLNLMKVLM